MYHSCIFDPILPFDENDKVSIYLSVRTGQIQSYLTFLALCRNYVFQVDCVPVFTVLVGRVPSY